MGLNVEKELAVLRKLSVGDLRARYAELHGDSTHSSHREWLIRKIAWRMQALAEGDLSERAKQRARELANDADLRVVPPRVKAVAAKVYSVPVKATKDNRLPAPGTIITRPYKGRVLEVTVLKDGFEFEGERYDSLSAVAKAITGSHCNGYLFFKLTGQGGER